MNRSWHWLARGRGPCVPRLALLLLAALMMARGGLAQEAPGSWRPVAQRLDAYSRGIALAVVAEEHRILSGAGAEIFALRPQAQRGLALDRDSAPFTWSTAGVVLDLLELDGALYAAAFRDGLGVFDSALPGERTAHFSIPLGHEAMSVAALDLGGARIVALGTQTSGPSPGGAVHLLLHVGNELHELARFDVGSAVFCLEAEPLGEAALALFLGTGCGTLDGAPAALQRWVLAWDEEGPSTLTRRSAEGWSPRASGDLSGPGVVRDLLLEPGGKRLFVAAFRDGVWALERDTLTPVAEPGWPLKLPNESPAPWACTCEAATDLTSAAFHALALAEFEGGRHLLVASGPARTDVSNIQFLSGLAQRTPGCNAGGQPEAHECPAEARAYGLFAFELLGQGVERSPVASLGKSGTHGGVPLIAFDLAAAPSPGGYSVYAALTGFGMHVFHGRREGLTWSLRHAASWGAEGPARLPGSAFDDLVWIDAQPPVLCAATEGGLATFAMTGPRPLSGPFEARKHNPTAP